MYADSRKRNLHMIIRSLSILLLCLWATSLQAQQGTVTPYEQGKTDYFQLNFGLNFGRNTPPDPFSSFFFEENNTGYQIGLQYGRFFTSQFQAGLGLHYASYVYRRAERTFGPSLTAKYRVNHPEQAVGVFVQAETAYEFPLGSRGQTISDREGGVAIHPSLGVELRSRNGDPGRLSLDVGYRFLQTAYRVDQFGRSELREPNYRRLVFRLGYTL